MFTFINQYETVLENHKTEAAIAYWDENNCLQHLTYQEIDEISGDITAFLKEAVKEKHVCIGLYMTHNYLIPSIIVSVLKSDFAFMFLDSNSHENNYEACQWVLSYGDLPKSKYLKQLELKHRNFILWKVTLPAKTTTFKDIWYGIHSSGTTGQSKLVKVQEESIMSNIFDLKKKFQLTHEDVIYFGTPLTFDPSMVELFLALISGACLLIVPFKVMMNPSHLLNTLFPSKNSGHKGVSVLQIVPSLFLRWNFSQIQYILQQSTCRILAFGGERFPEIVLKIPWSKNIRLFNLYGITEVSCWASVYEVKNDDIEIPLGEPLDSTILEVRDESGNKVNHGEGELYIGSFSRICYLNDEEKITKPLFRVTGDRIRINEKGLFYIGRKNESIKRYGHHINVPELEKKIYSATGLLNSCIWEKDTCKLVVFVVAVFDSALHKNKIIDKLHVKLLHSLPKHSFPDCIQIISSFPVTKNGKINKQVLLDIYHNFIELEEMRTKKSAEILTNLWCKYLGLHKEDIENKLDHNFFQLGGNSVLAIQCLSELQELLEVALPTHLITSLFETSLFNCCQQLNDLESAIHNTQRSTVNEHKKIKITIHKSLGNQNKTLKRVWNYNLEACVDSSPAIIERQGEHFVTVGSFAHIFVVLNCKDGTLISKFVLPDSVESSCCVSTRHPYIYSGCYDGKMYCLNFESNSILWEYRSNNRIKTTPCFCLQEQALVFGSYDKFVHCIKVEDGTVLWKTETHESITSSPLLYQHNIYIATTSGTCLCLKENDGEIQWTVKLSAPVFSSPCIENLHSFVVWADVHGTLYGISKDGKKDVIFKADGSIFSDLIRFQDYIIFGCYDAFIYCLQILSSSYELKFKIQLDSAIYSTPAVLYSNDETYIVTSTIQGCVYVINFELGEVVEHTQLPSQVFSSPVVVNNQIFVGCRDNNLYGLNFS